MNRHWLIQQLPMGYKVENIKWIHWVLQSTTKHKTVSILYHIYYTTYSRYIGHIQHDSVHSQTVKMVKHCSHERYLIAREFFNKKWQRYIKSMLHIRISFINIFPLLILNLLSLRITLFLFHPSPSSTTTTLLTTTTLAHTHTSLISSSASLFSDIDECSSGVAMCDQNCVNEPGTFHCTCADGYLMVNSTTCQGKSMNRKSHRRIFHAVLQDALTSSYHGNIDELWQERRNSISLAMELRLSCTSPSIWLDD